MAKNTGKTLLEIHASLVAGDPVAREEAMARLQKVYGNDPERICYASECASKNVLFFGEVPEGARPERNVVRVDFASWLVMNRQKPDEKSVKLNAEQEWRLMERASLLQDKTLCLMMLEAGYSPLPPAGVQLRPTSALQRFVHAATPQETAHFLSLLPQAARADVVDYVDGAGYNAVHVATHNPNVGIITLLHGAGANINLVFTANGKVPPRRAAHMAVLAGNVGVVAEIGAIDRDQFNTSPACPVTPYEMGMDRIQHHNEVVPRPVSTGRATPADDAATKQRAELLLRVGKATDIAAAFIGVPAPFGNQESADTALRAAGHKPSVNGLN